MPAVPCLDVVAGTTVVVVTVCHRLAHTELVGHLGRTTQVLTDSQATCARIDRLKRAANLARSIRLHIERLEQTGPTKQEQENH